MSKESEAKFQNELDLETCAETALVSLVKDLAEGNKGEIAKSLDYLRKYLGHLELHKKPEAYGVIQRAEEFLST